MTHRREGGIEIPYCGNIRRALEGVIIAIAVLYPVCLIIMGVAAVCCVKVLAFVRAWFIINSVIVSPYFPKAECEVGAAIHHF